MALPEYSMRQLLEAGVHYGHQTQRWNPRMAEYIYGDRNGIHIIDLSQTVPLFARALDFISSSVAAGGKVLFVGTKRQAREIGMVPVSDPAYIDLDTGQIIGETAPLLVASSPARPTR